MKIVFKLNKQLLINYFHVIVAINVEVQTPITSTPAVDPSRRLNIVNVEDNVDYFPEVVVNNVTNPPDVATLTSPTTGTFRI